MSSQEKRVSVSSVDKDLEKVEYRETTNPLAQLGISAEDAEFYETFPADKHKKLLRKIDIRLVPVLALLYLAAHIDRANIGNAKIEGTSCLSGHFITKHC